jgi:hypothetical protein
MCRWFLPSPSSAHHVYRRLQTELTRVVRLPAIHKHAYLTWLLSKVCSPAGRGSKTVKCGAKRSPTVLRKTWKRKCMSITDPCRKFLRKPYRSYLYTVFDGKRQQLVCSIHTFGYASHTFTHTQQAPVHLEGCKGKLLLGNTTQPCTQLRSCQSLRQTHE